MSILKKCDKSLSGKLVIPNGITTIDDSAFSDCTGLTSVTIPDSVTKMGGNAFSGCSNLTSVTIPDSVTTIGDNTFRNCSSLTDVYYTGTEEQWRTITININNSYLTNATIHYNYGRPE